MAVVTAEEAVGMETMRAVVREAKGEVAGWAKAGRVVARGGAKEVVGGVETVEAAAGGVHAAFFLCTPRGR